MEDILQSIETEKKERIINAAIEEFSKNGFDKASTNNIVKKAKVSKGLLYHYFKSKQDLYNYLISFVFKLVIGEIERNLDFLERDLLERIKQIALIKIEIGKRFPNAYDIIPKFYEDKTMEEIMELIEGYSPNIFARIYTENIDYGLFKDNIDVEKTINIIRYTMTGLGEDIQKQIVSTGKVSDISEYMGVFDEYLVMLKKAFYK